MKPFQKEILIKRPELQYESCKYYVSKPGDLLPYCAEKQEMLLLVNMGRFILRKKNIEHLNWYNPQQLPEEMADDHVSGIDVFLTSGDVVSIHAGMEYMLFSDTESSCYIITYHGQMEVPLPYKTTMKEPVSVLQLIRQLQRYDKSSLYPTVMCDFSLILIYCEILAQSVMYTAQASSLFQNVCEWIHSNAYRHITVRMTATQFGYNPDYLARVFRREYPLGIQQYIIQERINHIKYMLLTTDLPLKDIAQRLDFSDYKLFLKFFTHHVSLSPTQFRKIFSENDTFSKAKIT